MEVLPHDGVGDFMPDDLRVLYETRLPAGKAAANLSFEAAGPRETLFFAPSQARAAIVTCGGLCPGINNVIRTLFFELTTNYGVREILIEDDTFIISRKNVAEFCEAVLSEGLDISWSCLGRADRVDLDLLKLMRRAGCWHVSFGIESGDEDILKAVNKNLNIEQITEALMMCRLVN